MLKRASLIVALVGLCAPALAADTANHTVTVDVQAIRDITLTGGNITITVDDATGVQDATTSLSWSVNAASKVTVATDETAPNHTLEVTATGLTNGTAAGAIELNSATATDFVTGIAAGTGGCTLTYDATPTMTVDPTTGDDTHSVTYTVTSS